MIDFRRPAGSRGWWFFPTTRWATPRGLVVRAAVLLAGSRVVRCLGWREAMTFLSLTPAPGLSVGATTFRGVAYLALHMGAVIVVPGLLLAAVLLWIWNRVQSRGDGSPRPAWPPS